MMNRPSVRGTAVLAFVAVAGCDAFLGLDDKQFGTTTTTTGGSGGTTISSGGGGATSCGGMTTSSGGGGTTSSGGGGTTTSSGGGGTTTSSGGTAGSTGGTGGAPCGPGYDLLHADDEFNFTPCPPDSVQSLESRGWLFTWREEPYPPLPTYPGIMIANNQLQFGCPPDLDWWDGLKGALMYREIDGDFLVVTDVRLHKHDSQAIPDDEEAGAGIMARHPDSAQSEQDHQIWVGIDRGVSHEGGGSLYQTIHGSWMHNDANQATKMSIVQAAGGAVGKLALCRFGNTFRAFSKEDIGGSVWVEQTSTLAGFEESQPMMPTKIQVGLWLYAYNRGAAPANPDPIIADFDYVHQFDPGSNPQIDKCDPAGFGE